jgi:hypothetical protein
MVLLGGCKTTRLFHADFQADATGAEPNSSPPTQPVGDYISYASSTLGPQKLSVSSLMGKSLMVRSTPTGIPFAFVGIEKPHGNNPVYARYTGASLGVSAPGQPGMTVALASGHYQTAMAITFKNGKVYNGFYSEVSEANLLGDCPYAEPHIVLITFNFTARTYNLAILQTAAADIFRNNQPIDNDAFFSSERLLLAVFPQPGGETGNPMYAMDDVLITQKKPPDAATLKASAAAKPKPTVAVTRPGVDKP